MNRRRWDWIGLTCTVGSMWLGFAGIWWLGLLELRSWPDRIAIGLVLVPALLVALLQALKRIWRKEL